MFIHHCEKLKQKTQWIVHAGKTELQVHIIFWTNIDIGCRTLQFPLPHQIKEECKRIEVIYIKTKSCKQFSNEKYYAFYIYRWIYIQHNYPRYMQLPTLEWKNDNHIHHWTWQILTATVFHSTHGVYKFIAEKTVFWILWSTEMILH